MKKNFGTFLFFGTTAIFNTFWRGHLQIYNTLYRYKHQIPFCYTDIIRWVNNIVKASVTYPGFCHFLSMHLRMQPSFTEVRQITPKYPLIIIYTSVFAKLSAQNSCSCENVFCGKLYPQHAVDLQVKEPI